MQYIERYNQIFCSAADANTALVEWRTRYSVLETSAPNCDALLHALEEFSAQCSEIVDCGQWLGDFWEATRVDAFLVAMERESVAARALAATLEASYRKALCEAEVEDLSPRQILYRDFIQAQRLYEPSGEVRPWIALARATGFEPLRRVILTFLQKETFGRVIDSSGEAHLVTFANHREFLKHNDASVRQQAFDCADSFARENSSLLYTARRARIRLVLDTRTLLGAKDFYASHLALNRLPSQLPEILRRQEKRAKHLAQAYVPILKEKLGLEKFTLAHLDAPFKAQIVPTLSETWEAIAEVATTFSPTWGNIVRECERSGTVLTDPTHSRSPHWYMLTPCQDGAPLVHAPFKSDLESVQSTAHEMGHACHVTDFVRLRGAFEAQRLPLQFAEIFSLAFEIAVLKRLSETASTLESKSAWLRARIEQGLYFTRRMFVRARFDELLFSHEALTFEEADNARAVLEAESFGETISIAEARSATWLFDIFPEEMPYYGNEYGLAYLIACTLAESCPAEATFLAFAREGAMMPIEKSLHHYFGLDINDPSVFDPVWDALEKDLAAFSR